MGATQGYSGLHWEFIGHITDEERSLPNIYFGTNAQRGKNGQTNAQLHQDTKEVYRTWKPACRTEKNVETSQFEDTTCNNASQVK